MLYLIFVTFSYTSQFAFLPRLLKEGLTEQALFFYFYNPDSFVYFSNQTGYFFFGLAAWLFGTRYLLAGGLARWIGVLLFISGVFSFLAFLGLILSNNTLNMATTISGFLTLPLGIVIVFYGREIRRENSNRG